VFALIGFLALAGGMGGGSGGVTDSNNTTRTETHVLSDNRIFSPDTTIIVNSNNAPTTVTGDRNTTTRFVQCLTWDSAAQRCTEYAP